MFTCQENIAYIKDALRMRRDHNFTPFDLGVWYDTFIEAHRVEASKIDDVQVWCDFVTDQFIRRYMGRHNVSAEKVPHLPYDLPSEQHAELFADPLRQSMGGAEMKSNKPMISHPQPSGRFPKFNLPSAVEDGVDENGEIIVHNEHATIRMFLPITGRQGRGWRFGKNDPVTMKRVAPRAGELIDRGDNGTLYDWEPLNRPHTRFPMEEFFTGEPRPLRNFAPTYAPARLNGGRRI